MSRVQRKWRVVTGSTRMKAFLRKECRGRTASRSWQPSPGHRVLLSSGVQCVEHVAQISGVTTLDMRKRLRKIFVRESSCDGVWVTGLGGPGERVKRGILEGFDHKR
jgi:hypothetical protein